MAKDHFLGIRVDEELFSWMSKYSSDNRISVSQVVRQALIEMMGKTEALRGAKEKHDVEVLHSHIGDMFRFKKTENGLLLERVEPQTIVLGSGERSKKNGREARTA